MMLRSLLESFSVIVAIAIVLGMLSRWFLLGERRLMLQRQEERRAKAAQDNEVAGEIAAEPEENITLEQVNEQTQRLLRTLRLSLLALGLIGVWSGVLPAIARLDEIALWHFSDRDSDGATIQQPVTLMAGSAGYICSYSDYDRR
ncbi:MAG: hypothetical protein V9G16_00680 [Nitrosomonas sp.]